MNNFIEIDSKQIEIDHRINDLTKPTLIFLHEGLGCVAMWRDFPQQVAKATGCNLLVYGRFAYGQSSPAQLPRPVRYMHHEALTILPQILTQLNIGKHIFIGHSDGGSIALINGGGIQSPNLMGIITLAAHVFNEDICIQSVEEARVAYSATGLRQKLVKYHAHVDNAFWGWNDIWRHPDFWHWNIEEFLPDIRVPILVMQGLEDQYGTVAQVEAIVRGVGSKHIQRCLLPNCQHSPHRDQPEATLSLITAFIKKVETS